MIIFLNTELSKLNKESGVSNQNAYTFMKESA